MTYHIKQEDFQCQECEARFIPFRQEYPCPQCGTEVTEESYQDFIDELIHSMRVHKRKYGKYTPGTWIYDTLSEHVQQFCFQVFDYIENRDLVSKTQEREYLNYIVDEQAWQDDMPYIEKHVRDIVMTTYDKYLDRDRLSRSWWQKKKQNFFSKLKKFLP